MLVENGLVSEQAISREEILDCVFLVADVMRETWQTMSRETAAGMVLLVLAKKCEAEGLCKYHWMGFGFKPD